MTCKVYHSLTAKTIGNIASILNVGMADRKDRLST